MSLDIHFDLFLPQEMPVLEKVAESAAAIALHNFEWRYFTFMFFNTTLLYGFNRFLNVYDKSVIISKGITPSFADSIRQYVLFGRDVQDIAYMLDWLILRQFDNTGRYIILCESEYRCDEDEAVKTFWNHKITNVIFLKYKVGDNRVSGYTYFYSAENCAVSAPVNIDLDYCFDNLADCDWFPEKFKDLHKCTLIASTFQQPPYMYLDNDTISGCDGDLLLMIVEALNATLRVMTPHRGDGWGAIDPQGIWSGSLADVYFDYANISMTSAALTLNRFSYFQQSYYYNYVIIGWITCPPELQPSSLKLLHPFQTSTHIAVGLTLVIIVICSVLSSTLWKKYKKKLEVGKENSVIFYSWQIFVGLPTPKLPKRPFLLHIVFLWIWYAFLVRTMYQAALINSLKSNFYVPTVESIEEVLAANYKFGGGFALRDYFINYPEVYNNFLGINASELRRLAEKTAQGEKYVLAVNLEAVFAYYARHGESYHILTQKIAVSPTGIFFKKFSPLKEAIDNVLRRLFEAGIPDKLYRKFIRAPTKRSKRITRDEPMTTDHFKGCYAILFAGWVTSISVFFCEVFYECKYKTIVGR